MLTHASLFSGIGGFDLAARWAGWPTAFQVEINPYCQAVLAKNFPHALRHTDIHTFNGTAWRGAVDIISGGFPCQPYSLSGKRRGNSDDRALWPQMLRVIGEVRPRYVVGENVAGITSMDGGRVLSGILTDLEREGYRPEVFSIPALGVGAPHMRQRIWIVAHADGERELQPTGPQPKLGRRAGNESEWLTTNTGIGRRDQAHTEHSVQGRESNTNQSDRITTDTVRERWDGRPQEKNGVLLGNRHDGQGKGFSTSWGSAEAGGDWGEHWYEVASALCRMDDGLPAGLDGTGNLSAAPKKKKASGRSHRLEGLGNAIVPQVAFQIFNAINQYHSHAH